ncbi:hypothetical protein GQ600_17977 [Phytophthora cactorum]|nr:hypothetical protein GQ600_17977 [Phytophthora cactorum]
MNHTVSGGPRNSRCIVCTRTMFRIFMLRSCCRCELCSYNVCHACCSNQHVAIYNRHVAPLLVCDRCRESLARNEFDSQLRAVNPKCAKARKSGTSPGGVGGFGVVLKLSAAPRKVRLSDRELFARVQRVAVPDGSVDLRRLSSKRSWRRVRTGVTGGMEMQYRVLRASTSVAPTQTRQCQVVVGGEIKARTSELLSLLRAPTESESNALLRALYGSQFIYSSLLHAIPNSEQGSLPSPPQRGSIHASTGQQLMVRTVSFAHKGLSNPFKQRASTATSSDSITSDSRSSNHRQQNSGRKNEQCCFIDLLTPTQEGFRLAFCTLDTSEVTAGKAPPERVIALHPISGWLTAEPKPGNPGTLEITFQAAFPGNLPGGCDWRVAQARLLFIGRGICRLEKVLRRKRRFRRHQHTAPGRWWQAILTRFELWGLSARTKKAPEALTTTGTALPVPDRFSRLYAKNGVAVTCARTEYAQSPHAVLKSVSPFTTATSRLYWSVLGVENALMSAIVQTGVVGILQGAPGRPLHRGQFAIYGPRERARTGI